MYDLVPPAPIGRHLQNLTKLFYHRKFCSGMNADILVDRVHKYYWCKVAYKKYKIKIITISNKIFQVRNIKQNYNNFKHNLSGAQSGIHLLDLPPPLRQTICRCQTQNRATAHLSQVPNPISLSDNIAFLWILIFDKSNLKMTDVYCSSQETDAAPKKCPRAARGAFSQSK